MPAASRGSIEDDDLHAFVDEMLPPDASARVSTALNKNDFALDRVVSYRYQRLILRLLYENVIRQRVPQRMRRIVEDARSKARLRAACAHEADGRDAEGSKRNN